MPDLADSMPICKLLETKSKKKSNARLVKTLESRLNLRIQHRYGWYYSDSIPLYLPYPLSYGSIYLLIMLKNRWNDLCSFPFIYKQSVGRPTTLCAFQAFADWSLRIGFYLYNRKSCVFCSVRVVGESGIRKKSNLSFSCFFTFEP